MTEPRDVFSLSEEAEILEAWRDVVVEEIAAVEAEVAFLHELLGDS